MIFLRKKEYGILRFSNNEVFENCMGMLEAVYEVLSGPHCSLPTWLPPPHRISLRLAARLLRLPLKGGVIAGTDRKHPLHNKPQTWFTH